MIVFEKNYKVKPKQLIDDLAIVFKFQGLDDKKVKGQYFLKCPFHAGGQEKTASANFSLVENGRAKEGDFFCFGCRTKGHISSILTRLFGDKALAEEWIERMYGNLRGLTEEIRQVKKIEVVTQGEQPKQVFDLIEAAYEYETTYYGKRGIPDELVQKFRFGYLDEVELETREHTKFTKYHQVYLPVFDKEGDVVFFQLRSTRNKSFYLPVGAKKFIWGANWVTEPEVVVCESIFNAATAYKFGHQAVALFGTGDESTYQQLLDLPCRSYILCLDPDKAGRLGTKELKKFLRDSGKLVSTVNIDIPGRDLNDFANLSEEEFSRNWERWLERGIQIG